MNKKSSTHDERLFLVLNLDALHLTIALCKYSTSTCRVLDYVTHISHIPLMHEETCVFSKELRQACKATLRRLETKTGGELPQEIICVMNRKDFLAQPFSYTFLRDDPRTPISYIELDEYISVAQKKAYEQAKHLWSQQFLSDPRNMHLVSSSIHALEIDKSMVLHPIGNLGEHIRFSFLYVFCTQGLFDTAFRFFEKQGFTLSAIIPRQIAYLNSLYTQKKFFEDYVILDFGYYTTSVITHHGGKMQDFDILPIGAHLYEQLLRSSPSFSLTDIEYRSRIHEREKYAHSSQLREYTHILFDGLKMIFPNLETRISTHTVFLTGYYIYSDILEGIRDGMISPYIQPGCHMQELISSQKKPIDIQPITSLFSSKTLFNVYRDPLINIFRSHLHFHEI